MADRALDQKSGSASSVFSAAAGVVTLGNTASGPYSLRRGLRSAVDRPLDVPYVIFSVSAARE